MNFKKIGLGLAAAVSMTTGIATAESPAQALTISGNPNYDPRLALPTVLTVENEFANITNPSLGFSGVGSILVNSLSIKGGSLTPGFNANYDQTVGFVSNFLFDGKAARLTLLRGDKVIHTFTPPGTLEFTSTVNVIFDAIVEGLDGTDFAKVMGNFNATETVVNGTDVGGQSFALNVTNVQRVPTPALLPGLIGLGAAALRKKRKEGESEEALETAEVRG